MEANPLRRVLTAKATVFVGLTIVVAVVLAIISVASVSQTSEAAKTKRIFAAKEVISESGPLPVEGKYKSRGGKLIISAAGSGWSSAQQPGLIGMNVSVNGKQVGTAQVWTNEADSHKAFVSAVPVVYARDVGPGPVTIKLAAFDQTNTDENDFYRVTVVELPRNQR
jgi:hypothetical protein